jgi:UDP-2-acetamido-3-amino-2,3-dideoxy-glucuronate N-acetyltransferase
MNQIDCMIHELSDVQSNRLGKGTRIWQYCVVLPGAIIGDDCNICSHCFIENDVVIGDRVTTKCGVQIWDGTRIGSDVFIGPNVTFSNDRWPRLKKYPSEFQNTIIENGASIGANATILPGITIGEGAMVGAGSVVTRSIPRHAVVVGNPARIIRYTQSLSESDQAALSVIESIPSDKRPAVLATPVDGVSIHYQPIVRDMRGDLSVGEFLKDIPFTPKRYFFVFDVPSKETRGEHAHRTCHQFLICVRGSCAVVVDDGTQRMEISLDTLTKGVHLPPMVWGIQYKYSADAVFLVFASHYYDPADYIRNYADFIRERNNGVGDADGATQ